MAYTLAILIPYHNEGDVLTRCLKSIAVHTRPADEILIYDDASEVPPGPFVPPNISTRILRGERNRGPGPGRNALLSATKADYVHFHDADDLLSPDWGTRIRTILDRNNVDFIFHEISSYDGDTLVTEHILGLHPFADNDSLVRFCLQGSILASAGIYRTDFLRQIGGYRESLWQSEDYEFHVRVALAGKGFEIVEEPLVYRTCAAGRSSMSVEVFSSALQAVEILSRDIPTRFRRDLAGAAARFSTHLFRLGAYGEARKGFLLAQTLGPPDYRDRPSGYRIIARALGPEVAEWIAKVYHLIPATIREKLRSE